MKKITDLELDRKRVIVRVDYNVPIINGIIQDNNRIKESLETINYLIDKNCKIILMSHLGKIKSEEDKINNSLLPVKNELEKLLNKKIEFSKELIGENLERKVENLKEGEILLLENTRYMDFPKKLESNCDKTLSFYWASLADVFILDAFATSHRTHASTYGIASFIDHALGFLVIKEIEHLELIKNENKTLILGGAKVSDKIGVIKNLINKADKVLIGGAMSASFLYAKGYNVGKTFVDFERIKELQELLLSGKIIIPIDVVVKNSIKNIEDVNDNDTILDIGPKTIELFKNNINSNLLTIMNGTMGKYEEEKYSFGTKEIFEYLRNNNIKTVILGGDCAAASKKYKFTPYYLSTGGGAALEYLEGREMMPLKINM